MRLSILLLLLAPLPLLAQRYDTLVATDTTHSVRMMAYRTPERLLLYPRPTPATFLKYIPKTLGQTARAAVSRESLPAWAMIMGSTGLLFWNDQRITNGVQQVSEHIGLSGERRYEHSLGFHLGSTDVALYEVPGNLNTAVYSVGEGIPPFLIATGLLAHGLIRRDYRSLSTASQLAQGLLAVGISTQLLKRMTGREVPFNATQDRGTWRPFPGFSEFSKNKTRYDAFPSGHMATMMATVVILADNYPEKRWIRPLGYTLMTLVGLSMLNNGVHWASDYPLAIGIGYIAGKVTVNMNRYLHAPPQNKKNARRLRHF